MFACKSSVCETAELLGISVGMSGSRSVSSVPTANDSEFCFSDGPLTYGNSVVISCDVMNVGSQILHRQ